TADAMEVHEVHRSFGHHSLTGGSGGCVDCHNRRDRLLATGSGSNLEVLVDRLGVASDRGHLDGHSDRVATAEQILDIHLAGSASIRIGNGNVLGETRADLAFCKVPGL